MSKSAWFLVLSQCLAAPVPEVPDDEPHADSGTADSGTVDTASASGCQGGTWIWEDELTHDGCHDPLPDDLPQGADVGMRVEDSVVTCEEEGFAWHIGEFTFECADGAALDCVARGEPDHTLRGEIADDGTASGRWTWSRARRGERCATDWSFFATRR